MIEPRLVERELQRALITSARIGRPTSIQLVVRDAANWVPEAVRLQASGVLQRLGLADVPVCLLVEQRQCTACGWHAMPRRGQRRCPACGAGLGDVSGRPIQANVRFGGRPRRPGAPSRSTQQRLPVSADATRTAREPAT